MQQPEIEAAIAALRHPGRAPAEKGVEWAIERALAFICRDWLRRHKESLAACAAARRIGHAGLAYLATEADWAAILQQGKHRARQTVEALLNSFDDDDLADAIDDFEL